MNIYKKNVKNIILFTGVSLFVYATVIFTIDPLQQYRKASFYKPMFVNQRYINPGLVKTHEYNTVIIGASETENFNPRYVDEQLKVKTLKLSIEGSNVFENELMLNTAIKTGEVKNIIYSIDTYAFHKDLTSLKLSKIPLYLYDDNIFNDYKYLLNIDIFKKYLIKIALGNFFNKKDFTKPIEKFQYWGDKFHTRKQELLIEANKLLLKYKIPNYDEQYYNYMVNLFDNTILRNVKKNKNINYYFIFSPYLINFWIPTKNNHFQENINFKKHVILELLKFQNVKIYDFQDIEKIIYNFNNYQGITHYKPSINDYIIDSIKNNKYRVNSIIKINQFYKSLTDKASIEAKLKRYND